ncbi:MAG: hypothetical protein F6K16_04080 [Symploca sp. SIO2B6]|nr:hypothetical protein [Symploca sp. SIO2B6]
MLTSLRNPMVKQFRRLHQTKARQQQKMFVLEGTHLLEEACATKAELKVVCCTENWQQSHLALWETAIAHANRVELVSEAVLKVIATTMTPDGVVAIAQLPVTHPFSQ